nr:MAG TPA: tailspike protein [Caudoviricetes sp.]
MTISTSNRRAGPYLGDGIQREFPFTFKVFNAGDVRAFVADSQGRERALTYGTDYRVTLHDNQEAHPGGQLTLTVALATGEKLAIGSQTAIVQEKTFTNQGGFYPTLLNDGFDLLTVICQELQAQLARAMLAPVNATVTPSFPLPDAKKYLRWSDDGQTLVNDAFDVDAIYSRIAAFENNVNTTIGRMEQKLEAAQVQQLLEQARKLAEGLKQIDVARLLALEGRINNTIAELRALVATYDARIQRNTILALAGL